MSFRNRLPHAPLALTASALACLAFVPSAFASLTTASTAFALLEPNAATLAQDAKPEPANVAALSDNPKRCGLGAEFHGGRRAKLVKELESGILLMRGLPKTRDYSRFRQDKNFWYLTGVESPDAALLVDIEKKHEILFVPKPSPWSEAWEGEIWDSGDAWLPALTGFEDVRPIDELDSVLRALTQTTKTVWICKLPHVELSGCCDRARPYDLAVEKDALDGRVSREQALEDRLRERYGVDVKDAADVLCEMRRVKLPVELDALRAASQAGSRAMIEAMRVTRPGMGEWELEALMTYEHRKQNCEGPGYHAIVGSGPNALMLHYSQNARRLREGEMLLIDYAPEYEHYVSDITRSWPTDGQFTEKMVEIYDAVLAAQLAGIAAVKPGVTMRDVDRACRKVLSERGLAKLMPHGACHYVGMEVHDTGIGTKPLEPGVVFTVEPGVYDPKSKIGVRIEDVVVVTETGCEVLSADAPKERAAIEALLQSRSSLGARQPASAPLEPQGKQR